ncbi:hypothetical protein TNCV_4734751 [Trichonephila clavipes]|nr:hypothetical protein TNCV_4734751 [Trichonephila clavipes]
MLIVYGDADCNEPAAQWLNQERYPYMLVSHHTTFASVNRKLCETGSLTRADTSTQTLDTRSWMDRSWRPDSLACQITGPIMHGLFLLGSYEEFGV